jgi:molybdopterin-guanine dinucleotide biosynthesis protein A
MGGGDKARIRVGGATILERVVACLEPQCRQLILNANGDAARFADTGLTVVADGAPDYAGPLAGILAGLDWAANHAPEIEWIVSAPTDCPFLPRDLVERLHRARIDAGALLACACSAHRRHPVVALWPLSLRGDLRHAVLSEGERKVDLWTARHGIAIAEWATAPVDPFFNVNTPEDVAEADRMAARYPEI